MYFQPILELLKFNAMWFVVNKPVEMTSIHTFQYSAAWMCCYQALPEFLAAQSMSCTATKQKYFQLVRVERSLLFFLEGSLGSSWRAILAVQRHGVEKVVWKFK